LVLPISTTRDYNHSLRKHTVCNSLFWLRLSQVIRCSRIAVFWYVQFSFENLVQRKEKIQVWIYEVQRWYNYFKNLEVCKHNIMFNIL